MYAFLYVLLRNKFSKIVDEEKNKNPFVSKYFLAGTCAGISIVLDDRERANALAKYTMSRAAALFLQSGVCIEPDCEFSLSDRSCLSGHGV